MVRAHMKQASEEKKETPKKKATPPKKKPTVTGIWPCKINGCNKQFAREADLKRHQRTTKLHSLPGFACPQCDATFTRTDALRRHQKSRHNGVIIEPTGVLIERTKDTDVEVGSSGSKSRSRSATPSGKIRIKNGGALQPTVLAQPGTAGPLNSYYRHHAGAAGAASYLPPPGTPLDPQYAHGAVPPTPSTRLHQAWPAPPWPPTDGTGPPMSHLPYPVPVAGPVYYQASPYYRPTPSCVLSPSSHQSQINPDLDVESQDIPNGGTSSSDPGPSSAAHHRDGTPPHSVIVDPRLSQPDSSPVQRTMTIEAAVSSTRPAAPVIDPSLDAADDPDDAGPSSDGPLDIGLAKDEAGHMNAALSLKITQAAMEAVLESARRGGLVVESGARRSGSLHPLDGGGVEVVNEADVYGRSELEDEGDADLVAAGLMAEVDDILNDDEHMLDPADLLTRESLASSPSPS